MPTTMLAATTAITAQVRGSRILFRLSIMSYLHSVGPSLSSGPLMAEPGLP